MKVTRKPLACSWHLAFNRVWKGKAATQLHFSYGCSPRRLRSNLGLQTLFIGEQVLQVFGF
jgi:hypothetical protein